MGLLAVGRFAQEPALFQMLFFGGIILMPPWKPKIQRKKVADSCTWMRR